MRTDNAAKRKNPNEWTAEQLRLTTFHPAEKMHVAEGLFKKYFGEDADSVVDKPREGIKIQVGRFHGSQVLLNTHTKEGRIDWFLQDHPEQTPDDPTSKCLNVRLDLFRQPTAAWLADNDIPFLRMAYGAIVAFPVSSREDGFDLFNNYLTFDVDRNASDLLFQINRRRASKVIAKMHINRLTKWSVAATTQHLLRIGIGMGMQSVVANQSTPVEYSCRIELDISTAQDYEGGIPKGNSVEIYNEMISLGEEIVKEGDIA